VDDLKNNAKSFMGRDFSVGAMIGKVQHKITKTGKPFGSFSIEDYNGSLQLQLFGESYLRFKHLLNNGEFIHLSGDMSKRFPDSEELFPRVKEMKLLSEVLDHFAKTITLSVRTRQLDADGTLADTLLKAIKACPGNSKLRIYVHDDEESLAFAAPKRFVSPSQFLRKINEIQEFRWQLNEK
jgi:DNA polymerase-3 subunit alpha